MAITQQDAEDAILEGHAEAEEFMQEFLQQWHSTGVHAAMKRAWTSIPPQLKEKVRAQNPDQYQKVVDFINRKK